MPTGGEYSHYKENRKLKKGVWKSEAHRDAHRSKRSYYDEEGSVLEKPRRRMRMLPHFCKAGSMHRCDARESTDRQHNCHFFLPATGCARCMELRFDEYCGNLTLHKYIAGAMSDEYAKKIMDKEKNRLAKIQNKAEGYNIDFPLEGEETVNDLMKIYDQLVGLGMTQPEFWEDQNGKPAESSSFSISVDEVRTGKWCPKRKELKKDILKYFDLKEKLGV